MPLTMRHPLTQMLPPMRGAVFFLLLLGAPIITYLNAALQVFITSFISVYILRYIIYI